jgi:hypothetical protein
MPPVAPPPVAAPDAPDAPDAPPVVAPPVVVLPLPPPGFDPPPPGAVPPSPDEPEAPELAPAAPPPFAAPLIPPSPSVELQLATTSRQITPVFRSSIISEPEEIGALDESIFALVGQILPGHWCNEQYNGQNCRPMSPWGPATGLRKFGVLGRPANSQKLPAGPWQKLTWLVN